MVEYLDSDDFRNFLIEEYTAEKIRNPDSTLEKYLPVAKRKYLEKKCNTQYMQLDMIANKSKKKEVLKS